MSPLQIMSAFPTHVGAKEWEDTADLNRQLKEAIYKRREEDPTGLYRSNTAGTWHSDDGLLRWTGEAGKKLSQMFGESFRAYAGTYGADPQGECDIHMMAWGMVYTNGGYATVHSHPNCHFSGVYYVDTDEADEITMATGARVRPGDIEFVDTRGSSGYQRKGLKFQTAFRITPKSGQMIIFPSWFPHFVHPVRSGERIAISCNATILKYIPPKQEKENDSDQ
ncbi:MAG: hypothetical protein GEU78_07900 [Actinobacteria bacterium]|nr:hypothetical protein [Actinomycetota bacterium]